MKKKLILVVLVIGVLLGLFLLTGRARTDVYLKDFVVSADGKIMTLEVGVAYSSGYVRKVKRTSGSMNYYLTFYSTYGINSKIGAKDTFEIELDSNVDEIYFYSGNKGYKLVLQKNDDTGEWSLVKNSTIDVSEKIEAIVEGGPLTSSNPFDYINASGDIYDELLSYPKETFEYAIKDLIETNANEGLKSYIEALLCSKINKSFEYDFESAGDFLEEYKEFLKRSGSNISEYDEYAKSLLK